MVDGSYSKVAPRQVSSHDGEPPPDLAKSTLNLPAIGGLCLALFGMAGGYFGLTGQIAQNNAQIAALSQALDAGRKRGEAKDEKIATLQKDVLLLQTAQIQDLKTRAADSELIKGFGNKLDDLSYIAITTCQAVKPGIQCRAKP